MSDSLMIVLPLKFGEFLLFFLVATLQLSELDAHFKLRTFHCFYGTLGWAYLRCTSFMLNFLNSKNHK